MAADPPLTRSLARFGALLAALGAGPLGRPALLERLGAAYPRAPDSARRMIARDIAALGQLGIRVEVSRARPPIYTLRGGTPLFQPDELRALGLIRDSFGDRHPQAAAIHALLATLTAGLSQPQQAEYARQLLDYRVDRVSGIDTLQTLPPHLSRTHNRPAVSFRYRLAAVLARGEISQRFENQQIVERLPNGDVVIEAEGRSDFFIIQMLLRYRGNAELLHPVWLRAKMAEEVRRLAAVYGELAAEG